MQDTAESARDADGCRGRIRGVGQIHVTVDDIARAVAFYRDVLGLPLLFEVPGQSMAFFDCGGVRLYLGESPGDGPRSNAMIYYRVEDITAAHAVMTERGADFEHPPRAVHRDDTHELWIAACRDTEGNWVHLMSEVANEA